MVKDQSKASLTSQKPVVGILVNKSITKKVRMSEETLRPKSDSQDEGYLSNSSVSKSPSKFKP